MSERYDVRVRIGGKLKRTDVDPLLAKLSAEELGTGWGEEFHEADVRSALAFADGTGQPAEFMTHESDGELDDLRTLLQSLNLFYHVELSGNDQYAPTTAVWHPGELEGHFLTSDNKPVILLELIQEANTEAKLKKLIGDTITLAAPLPGLQLVD